MKREQIFGYLKFILLFLGFEMFCIISPIWAGESDIEWEKTYGSGEGKCVRQTFDGGYIVAGSGNGDVLLIKTKANGDTSWTRHYGGTKDDAGYCVQQTSDSGYIIVGSGIPFGRQDKDVWLIKTDADGDTLWTKFYGNVTGSDGGYSVQQNQDGGYVIVGSISEKFSFIKTNSNGDTLWTRSYSVSNPPGGYCTGYQGMSSQETFDKGYAAVGYSTYNSSANPDIGWFIKVDSLANTLWNKSYQGSIYHASPDFYSMQQTSDSGYIIIGTTGDPAKDDTMLEQAVLITKTDMYGDVMWVRTYGGYYPEAINPCYSVQQTLDGCYIVTRRKGDYGYENVWCVKVAPNGDTLWSRMLGTGIGYSVRQTSDKGYIIGGVRQNSVLLIKTNPQVVVLLSPDEGTLPGGTVQPINWFTEGTLITSYNLFYSTDGGANYDTIATGILPDSAFSSYDWTLPVVDCTTCRIKIQGLNAEDSIISEDISTTNFTIRTYPTVVSPNGGEVWTNQGIYPITWSTFGKGKSFNLLYSTEEIWNSVTYPLSSPHPYPNIYNSTFIISDSETQGLKIHFDSLDTEPGYDSLYIYNENDSLVISYSGVYSNFWTPEIMGDTAKIRIKSDATTNGYGFDIDSIAIMTGKYDTIATNVSPDSIHWDWELPDVESNNCYVKIQLLDSMKNVVSEDENDASFTITNVATEEKTKSQIAKLEIYPNPVNRKPLISYYIPSKSKVLLKLYDITGRDVKTLVNESKEAGNYNVKLDTKGLANGIYFVKFIAGEHKETRKLILIE